MSRAPHPTNVYSNFDLYSMCQQISDFLPKYFQVKMFEEKITHYALKVAEHEKNTMLHKKEQQSTKKELEVSIEYKTKYERWVL